MLHSKTRKKGQMFLITGLFILLVLILLKTETSQSGSQAFYSSIDWKSSFENIENEYRKAADISLAQEKTAQNLERNLDNFTNFSLDSFSQRGYSLQSFYSFAFANATNITVAFGSFQGDIRNISVNISAGQSAFFPSLANRLSNSTAFPPADRFNVTVSYYLNDTAKNLTYFSNSNITAAVYVSLKLQQADSFIDGILQFNRTSN